MLDALVAARLLLGLVFLGSAVTKFLHLARFRRIIGSYGLLPERMLAPVGLGLPPAELCLAVALLSGWESRFAAACGDSLLTLFAAAVAINVVRRNQIDCGCGGWDSPSQVGWSLVARNLVLASLATALVISPPAPMATLLEHHAVSASDLLALTLCAGLAFIPIAVARRTTGLSNVARTVAQLLPNVET
jgi:uncharacterized membrane protein YphA (DoxX/SURF4 family)